MKNRPMTRVNLDKAIARMAGEDPRMIVGIRMSMANAIVGQFLPEGVVKGGTSLKFRFGSDHARYTLDLQLILGSANVDLAETRAACERLFRYRKCQAWPPKVVKVDGWDEIYTTQKLKLPVLPTVDDAIAWTNDLIAKIDAARSN